MNEIQPYRNGQLIELSEQLEIAQRYGKLLAASGYYKDAADLAKAATKVLIGSELGIPPVAAMQGITVIQGKPVIAPYILAGLVRRSGVGRIEIVHIDNQYCELRAFRLESGKWVEQAPVVFDINEAKSAGLTGKDNWKNYTQDMLYARALGRCIRRYFQDVFLGIGAVYTDGELVETEIVEAQPRAKPTLRERLKDGPLAIESSPAVDPFAPSVPVQLEEDTPPDDLI